MRRIAVALAGLVGAAGLVLAAPGTQSPFGSDELPASNDALVTLGPDQLANAAYLGSASVSCTGSGPSVCSFTNLSYETAEFPKGNNTLSSVNCSPISPFTFSGGATCSANDRSGKVSATVTVNQDVCNGGSNPFLLIHLVKGNGDELALTVTSSCP
jgi:hypothetical protein